jgi:hypothetical protein
MRSALALYALRFGGWLLARASGLEVDVTVDLYDEGPAVPVVYALRFGGWSPGDPCDDSVLPVVSIRRTYA